MSMKNIFIEGAIAADFISESIARHAVKTDIGAHSIFLGQVRADQIGEQTVSAIEYTSHKSMALEKMHDIRNALFEKYDLTCLHVFHSTGMVHAGEICLFVFASSGHRKAAIDACTECVERIKAELPIWGREIFDTGRYQWKENK